MIAPNIIPSIFTAKDMITIPAAKMGAAISRLGIISEVTSARMERAFMRTSAIAMDVAHSAGAIGLGLIIPLGLATNAAVKFEQQMGNVATLVDTTKESMGDMGDEVLKMSKKIPVPLHDLTKGLYQIRSDGIKAGNGINEAFGVLESSGKLAVAGLSTLEEAAKTVTSAMNVFSDAGLNSEQIANSMFKTVQGGKTTMAELGASFGKNAAIIHSAGVSLYEMNAATAAITATGITASQAQNELGAAVLALMKPTGNLQTIFENMGLAGEGGFKKLIVSAGGLVPAMQAINAKAKELGITMSEDFGRKEALVANILLTGERNKAYYEALANQMNGQDTLLGKFAEQSKTAAAQMQLFRSGAERLGISVGNLLIPPLTRLMNTVSPLIDGIADFGKKHKWLSGLIVDSLGGIGMLALGVGAVSLVVGTVTKAWVLWNGAIKAYNFLAGFAAVKTGVFNYVIQGTPAYLRGATLAMTGFGNSAKVTLGVVTSLAFALYEINSLMNDWNSKNALDKEQEKQGRWMNTAPTPIISKMAQKGYSRAQIDSASESGYMGVPMPVLIAPGGRSSADSTKSVARPEGLGANPASMLFDNPSRQSGADDIQHKVTIEIQNNSGHPISATSSNAAVAVQVKTKNTFYNEKMA